MVSRSDFKRNGSRWPFTFKRTGGVISTEPPAQAVGAAWLPKALQTRDHLGAMQPYVERYEYRAGFIFSILVHIVLLYIIQHHQPKFLPPDQVFSVELEPEAPPRLPAVEVKTQIVTAPENSQEKPPLETNLLAERDSSAERQQIRRGDHLKADNKPAEKAPAAQNKEPRQQKQNQATQPEQPKAPTEPLKTLKLDQATVLDRFSGPKANNSVPSSNTSGYRAFSRPMGSGAAFIGLKGTTDFLPNLPDGDITLLNTKADRFAVFVRRVASQVFGQLRASGWENLSASDIARMSDDTQVIVVMRLNGELESIKLIDGSGSTAFDRVVVEAARSGARDPNPPPAAAASDGKIHFTFQARSWVQAATNQRTGAPTERRWLLLATGLD